MSSCKVQGKCKLYVKKWRERPIPSLPTPKQKYWRWTQKMEMNPKPFVENHKLKNADECQTRSWQPQSQKRDQGQTKCYQPKDMTKSNPLLSQIQKPSPLLPTSKSKQWRPTASWKCYLLTLTLKLIDDCSLQRSKWPKTGNRHVILKQEMELFQNNNLVWHCTHTKTT